MPDLKLRVRAAVILTGTELLWGRIVDRNGPWLAARLLESGVELAQIVIVGDHPEELRAALDFLAGRGVDLIVTTGGLGPTADDVTAKVVAEFAGTTLVLDPALEQRIRAISRREREGRAIVHPEALLAATRKQAMVPRGATVLEPVGTAPGFVVPPRAGAAWPTVVALPGPPREVREMWDAAVRTHAVRVILARAGSHTRRTLRLLGRESELTLTLQAIEEAGVELGRLDVNTLWHGDELEMTTHVRPDDADVYAALEAGVVDHHGEDVFSIDGATVDEIVARLLGGRSVAVVDAGSAGLLAARLGNSTTALRGALIVGAWDGLRAWAWLPGGDGADSTRGAAAMAEDAITLFRADVGIGLDRKAVAVATSSGRRLERALLRPGHDDAARHSMTTQAMHALRVLLQQPPGGAYGDGSSATP